MTAVCLNEVGKFLGERQYKIILISHRQTVPGGYFYRITTFRRGDDASEPLLGSSRSGTPMATMDSNEEPVPLRNLLNLEVLLPVLSYGYLGSLHSTLNAIQPLFLAMTVSIGGLGLSPRSVGYILSIYGFANSFFQLFMLGPLVRKFGVKALFITSISAFIPICVFWPVMNILVRSNGYTYVVWIVLGCQLSASLVMELGFGVYPFKFKSFCSTESGTGCAYMYITAASPNKRSLGATNGLAQTISSIGRMITPALANSLLSFSIRHHILWGYASYMVLIFLTIGAIVLASKLPKRLN